MEPGVKEDGGHIVSTVAPSRYLTQGKAAFWLRIYNSTYNTVDLGGRMSERADFG